MSIPGFDLEDEKKEELPDVVEKFTRGFLIGGLLLAAAFFCCALLI